MKKILIVGNGFDLFHHYKTSYSDFINFCQSINMYFNNHEKFYDLEFLHILDNKNIPFHEKDIIEAQFINEIKTYSNLFYSLLMDDLSNADLLKKVKESENFVSGFLLQKNKNDIPLLNFSIAESIYNIFLNDSIPKSLDKENYSFFSEDIDSEIKNIYMQIIDDINQLLTLHLKNIQSIMNVNHVSKSSSRKFINYIKNSDDKLNIKLKLIQNCRYNYWLDFVDKNQSRIGDRWCDFEYQIGLHVEAISFIVNNPNIIYNEDYPEDIINLQRNNVAIKHIIDKFHLYTTSKNQFYSQIENIESSLHQHLNNLTYLLKFYLRDYLNDIKINQRCNTLFKQLNVDYLLSFNYTNTYEKIYNPNITTHYIHGSIQNNNENNMVFGIGQEIKNSNENDDLDYISFQKYYQRIIKKTGNEYKDWLNSAKENKEDIKVYLYGHSLDVPDGDIIKEFVNYEKSTVNIFYYNQNSLENIVKNLIKTFGKENIITYTGQNKIKFIHHDENTKLDDILIFL